MFVTANKNVNRRQGSASASSPCTGYIPADQSVEVLGLAAGDEIDGNSLWYRSAAGEFLWSGGFAPTEVLILQADGTPVDLSDDVRIAVYESALHELCSWFLPQVKNCTGLALGHQGDDPDARLCLVVLINELGDGTGVAVPASLNYRGVALVAEVRQTGGVRAATDGIYSDDMVPIMVGGGTLGESGDPKDSFGTRTALVQSEGKSYILTCYHVACYSRTAAGNLSLPAGQTVGVDIPALKAGSTVKKSGQVTEGTLGGTFDYALVAVDSVAWINPLIVDIGNYNGFYQLSDLSLATLKGLPVQQYGAKTNRVCEGAVTNYKSDSVTITYAGKVDVPVSGLIITSVISQEGDSGAPVVDSTGKLLGHVVAFDKQGTYVMPFAYLNYYKSITLTQ